MKLATPFALPNTLALPAWADFGAELETPDDVCEAIQFARAHRAPLRILGAGSNVIVAPQVAGFVGRMSIVGIDVVDETDSTITIRVGGGENWHQLVLRCITNGWYGIENLALIPGTVGAAPVQNIGAYGAELADFVVEVEGFDDVGRTITLDNERCGFGYRSSIFQLQPGLTITHVRLQLQKVFKPRLGYPGLRKQFAHNRLKTLTARQVADAVIAMRQARLPDPDRHPNVGSFFKNPVVSAELVETIRALGLDAYLEGDGYKLSAAQLIDYCGWKDKPAEKVACWPNQALVLVNQGGAEAADVLTYAAAIRADVQARLGVALVQEPTKIQ